MIKSLIIRRATYIGRTGNILQLFRLKMFVYIFDPKVAKLALPALLFPVSSVCCDFMLAIVILDVLFAAPCSIPPLIVCLPALMTLHCTYFVFGSLYLCFFLAEIPPCTPCWWPAVKPYDSLILEVLDRFCIFFASDTHTHMTMWFGPKSVENLHGRAQNEVIPMPNRKWQNLRGSGKRNGKNWCGKAWKSERKLFSMQCTDYKAHYQGVVLSDFIPYLLLRQQKKLL